MSKDVSHRHWGTKSELNWLSGLGTGRYCPSNAKIIGVSRIKLFKNYIKSLRLREKWDGIDKEEVLKVAKEQLRQLELQEERGY